MVQDRVDARVRAARDGKVMPEDDIPERAGDSGGERGLARTRFIAKPLDVDTFNVADRRPCSAREHAGDHRSRETVAEFAGAARDPPHGSRDRVDRIESVQEEAEEGGGPTPLRPCFVK